ncbi:hypothetical protein FRC17_005761 [Serendipita sp. 399]|nr:hypothetical protein FRC17_005761 [Serendipita sp. 399]
MEGDRDNATALRVTKPPALLLPIEVLQYIFRIVTGQSLSIRNIRLTCRDWRDLVASDISLPRNIILLLDFRCVDNHQPNSTKWDYCVHNAAGLARALDYIQDSHFAFHVTLRDTNTKEDWSLVPWFRFSKQCVQFRVDPGYLSSHKYFVTILENIPVLHRLKSVKLQGNPLVLTSVLRRIPPNSNVLRSLDLLLFPGDGTSYDPKSLINEFGHVFYGSRKLVCFQALGLTTNDPLIAFFKLLNDVEELRIRNELARPEDADLVHQSVDWKIKPRVLQVGTTLFKVFPPFTLGSLTELHLFSETTETEYEMTHLPTLVDLTLVNSWIALTYIEAPQLKSLHLLGGHVQPDPLTKSQHLRPALVEIAGSEKGKEVFISTSPFPGIVELHVRIGIDLISTIGRLAESLSFDVGKGQPLWLPQLERLFVILYSTPSDDLGRLQQEISKSIQSRPRPVEDGGRCPTRCEFGIASTSRLI